MLLIIYKFNIIYILIIKIMLNMIYVLEDYEIFLGIFEFLFVVK